MVPVLLLVLPHLLLYLVPMMKSVMVHEYTFICLTIIYLRRYIYKKLVIFR